MFSSPHADCRNISSGTALQFAAFGLLWVVVCHVGLSFLLPREMLVHGIFIDSVLFVLLSGAYVYHLVKRLPVFYPQLKYQPSPLKPMLFHMVFGFAWLITAEFFITFLIDDFLSRSPLLSMSDVLLVFLMTVGIYLFLESVWNHIDDENYEFDPVRGNLRLFLPMFVLAASVPLICFGALKIFAPMLKQDAFAELEVRAQNRGLHIRDWIHERHASSELTLLQGDFINNLEKWRHTGNSGAFNLVKGQLEAMRQIQEYRSVVLFDDKGRMLLTLGDTVEKTPEFEKRLESALKSRQEGSRTGAKAKGGGGEQVMTENIVPIFSRTGHLLGSVFIRVNLDDYISTYMTYWPTNLSVNLQLARRGKDGAVTYYYPLHGGFESAQQRIGFAPRGERIQHREAPESSVAVKAVRSGLEKGTIRAINAKGLDVLAAWAQVSGTGWYFIVSREVSAVEGTLRNLVFWVSSTTVLFLLIAGCIFFFVWRTQYRNQKILHRLREEQLLGNFYTLPFVGMVIISSDLKTWQQFNDRICEILGYTRAELEKMPWSALLESDDAVARDARLLEELESGKLEQVHMQRELLRKNGDIVITDVHLRCIRRKDGSLENILMTLEDITQRKRDEMQIHRLSQFYAALSRCNQAIVHSRDTGEMFRNICHAIVDHAEMTIAWIGWVDPDNRIISPVCSYSSRPDFAEQLLPIKISLDENDPDWGRVTGEAIRENRPVWLQHVSENRDAAGVPESWKKRFGNRDILSIAVLPLRQDGVLVGTLNIYSDRPDVFDISSQELFAEMMMDINFALEHFKREEQLLLSKQVIEQSSEGLMLTDRNNRIVMINPAFTAMTGYGFDDVSGKEPDILSSGIHDDDFFAAMRRSIDEDGHWQGEIFNRRKDGVIHPVWFSISAMRDAGGRPTHHIAMFTDLTENKDVEERIYWLSHFDSLTGLPNRTLLHQRCSMAISFAQQKNESLSLLFIDLDAFKNVNDSLGHSVGDELLRQFTGRLQSLAREQDTIARLGGDEFVLLFSPPDADDVSALAARLLSVAASPYVVDHHEINMTASIGIARYPLDGNDFEALLRSADSALYRAKEDGRNNYSFFTADMRASSVRMLSLDSAMRRALERDQFTLHYQPKMSLADGRIVGFEALCRWNHPDLGFVSPAEFIPIAETNREIIPIGEWIMRTAARQLREWHDNGFNTLSMSINLSVVQFRHPRLLEMIMDVLEEFSLPPEFIHMELTEGVAMEDPVAAIAVIDGLHRRGLRISIDDFGTGYSSLAYLKRFSVYSLKIDRSFVQDVPGDADSRAIVETVVSLASNLGMITVAEGVETEEQLAFLRDRGCDEIQGYFLSRPLPCENVPSFLVSHELKRSTLF